MICSGINVELRLDAGAIQHRVAHGVDQRDAAVDQLRHVLVAGGYQHLLRLRAPRASPGCRSHRRPRPRRRAAAAAPWRAPIAAAARSAGADHPASACAAPCTRRTARRERFYPARRTPPRCAFGRYVLNILLSMLSTPSTAPGGLATRVGQRRQGVEGPVEVRRAVD